MNDETTTTSDSYVHPRSALPWSIKNTKKRKRAPCTTHGDEQRRSVGLNIAFNIREEDERKAREWLDNTQKELLK